MAWSCCRDAGLLLDRLQVQILVQASAFSSPPTLRLWWTECSVRQMKNQGLVCVKELMAAKDRLGKMVQNQKLHGCSGFVMVG